MVYLIHFDQLSMLIKSAENPSHFYHLSSFSRSRLLVLVIKRVQRVLPKLHVKRTIIRTLSVKYGTLQKNKRSSELNLPKQRQVFPSLFFQFNMRISGDLWHAKRVSCKRVVDVLSPLASNSCGGSHLLELQMGKDILDILPNPSFDEDNSDYIREYFSSLG